MSKFYYYSFIGLSATGETFMKIVCVETANNKINGSNEYITKSVNYILSRYNVAITNISVLFSTNTKYNNMPNVDYII